MPNRLIRDEMLESEAILSLPIEARWFYVTILLSADDVGLFEATSFKLARRADIRRESGDKLLQMLADADLIRLYEVAGKRYGFIPKFRQRIQIKYPKHPLPPKALMEGDDDALNKINELGAKTTVGQPFSTDVQQESTAIQPPEAKAKALLKSPVTNVTGRPANAEPEVATVKLPECSHKAVVTLYHEVLPTLNRVEVWNDYRQGLLRSRWREVAQELVKDKQPSDEAAILNWWRSFFGYIGKSKWLTGRVEGNRDSPFKADLEWIIRPKNFAKIIEGAYHRSK
jgi:hypothetical protein